MTTAVKFSKHQIYGILRDYHWMVKEIKRIDRELQETDFQGTAQYGIEATLPKPQGVVGRALESEAIRRVNKSKRLNKFIQEVIFINENIPNITDEKEKVVLDCLLDGMSLTAISIHLGVSRRHVSNLRDGIVDKLAK
ncbi:helix-turn-helix domain-containing protein [Robertmurraya siralis]|uniref:DNA-binding response regulator n=1 Tax=Robertmurraya siralis TaxID=77777 RepID=UPI0010FA19A3|nr:DNA-binding response regulator [Robertmurraya siralis]